MNKIKLLLICLLLLINFTVFSQDSGEDKYTTVNIMINQVWVCEYGLVVDYFSGGEEKQAIFPNIFMEDKTVIKVFEDNVDIAPQMNVVYKNLKPYRVKLYMSFYPSGTTYPILDYVPQELRDKFNNTKELVIPLAGEGTTE